MEIIQTYLPKKYALTHDSYNCYLLVIIKVIKGL